MRIRTHLIAATVLAAGLTTPATAQTGRDFWQNKWFWGAQAGAYLFTIDDGQAESQTKLWASAGGQWFITAGRSALELSFDLAFGETATRTFPNGLQAEFSSMERYQAVLYAFPSFANLNIILGGGFAIHNVSSATPLGSFATPQSLAIAQDQIDDASTKAFFLASGGLQYRLTGRWVIFGEYQFIRGTDTFIITSTQHSLQGGIRFALVGATEEVGTTSR